MSHRFRNWFRFVGVPLLGAFGYVFFIFVNPPELAAAYVHTYGDWAFVVDVLLTIGCAVLFSEGGLAIAARLNRRLPWEKAPGRRFCVQLALQMVLTLLVVACLRVSFGIEHAAIANDVLTWQALFVAVAGSLLMMAVSTGEYFFSRWKMAMVEAEEVKRASLQAQLDALRAQMDPHFLFNSLNALAALIAESPSVALSFVERLAQVYRYVLQSRHKTSVSVREELEFLRAYAELCMARFEQGLEIGIDVDEAFADNHVPPLAMQHLVENAMKHNVVSRESPLRIRVSCHVETPGHPELVVSNNRQPKPSEEKSTRVGLDNLMSCCRMLAGESVHIDETATDFTVHVPLLPCPRESTAA